jgi:hypothetical protein
VRPFNGTGLTFVERQLNLTSRQNVQSFVNPFDVSSRTALPGGPNQLNCARPSVPRAASRLRTPDLVRQQTENVETAWPQSTEERA